MWCLCIVEPDRQFGFLDPRGAQESARRKSLEREGLRKLDRSVPDVSVAAERAKQVALLPASQAVPVIQTIRPAENIQQIGAELRETRAERDDRVHRASQDAMKKRIAVRERVTGRSIING